MAQMSLEHGVDGRGDPDIQAWVSTCRPGYLAMT